MANSGVATSLVATTSTATISTSLFFSGSSPLQVDRGVTRVTCRKKDIHPKFYDQAKVYCNGELVMTTGGTQPEYIVDVWSGNHPFYQGKETAFLQDADRVERFNKRFGSLTLSNVPILTKGEIVFEKKKKGPVKGKGKK